MSQPYKNELFKRVAPRYQKASKEEKSRILDEFSATAAIIENMPLSSFLTLNPPTVLLNLNPNPALNLNTTSLKSSIP